MTDTEQMLRDVLARLDALERDNTILKQQNERLQFVEQENRDLHAEVVCRPLTRPVAAIDDGRSSQPNAPVVSVATTVEPVSASLSRRGVLSTGLKLAAGAFGAGAMLAHEGQSAAADSQSGITTFDATCTQGACNAHTYVVRVMGNTVRNGLYAESDYVEAINAAGIGDAIGVYAHSDSGFGLHGHSNSGAASIDAVHEGGNNGSAFRGTVYAGTGSGASGISFEGNGVSGYSRNTNASGVYGENTNRGYGVAGDTTSSVVDGGASQQRAGTFGRNNGSGPGVVGLSVNNSGDGVLGEGKVGVHGTSAVTNSSAVLGEASGSAIGVKGTSPSGYGAVFGGGRAQVRLVPRPTTGKPTTGSHQVGELYLDKVSTLFICTAAGTPGTWRKVSTTAA